MGVTGQGAEFHKEVRSYLTAVREATDLPVMMGFGIRTAADVLPLADLIDGAIVGSYFKDTFKDNGEVSGEHVRAVIEAVQKIRG